MTVERANTPQSNEVPGSHRICIKQILTVDDRFRSVDMAKPVLVVLVGMLRPIWNAASARQFAMV